MLQQIEAKLQEVSERVFYGYADDIGNNALWNYIVFERDNITPSANETSYTDYYNVHIIHENFVPDELIKATIASMKTLPGMRLAKTAMTFDYSSKPGTDRRIEIISISFCRPWK